MSASGPLVLLGGEGLRPEARSIWERVRALSPRGCRIAVLPLAVEPSSARQQAAHLTEQILNQIGFAASLVSPTEMDSGVIESVDTICLLGADPTSLCAALQGHDAHVWDAILQRHKSGAALAATGVVTAVLGELSIAPVRPFPQQIEALGYQTMPGMRLLSGAMMLPYFDRLQPVVLDKVAALCPEPMLRIGIDEQAALIAVDGRWQTAGLGNVTILRDNQLPSVIPAESPVPDGLLPPFILRGEP